MFILRSGILAALSHNETAKLNFVRPANYGLWCLILTLIQGSVGFAERGATTVSNLLPAIWQHAWGGGAGH
ncbi:hypothetical protein SPHINGOT1_230148 [Sphingomonas sp. T1]|nr:hypothetical protein SPHINGOT1_230148 [Sphingomonas sp. T1]